MQIVTCEQTLSLCLSICPTPKGNLLAGYMYMNANCDIHVLYLYFERIKFPPLNAHTMSTFSLMILLYFKDKSDVSLSLRHWQLQLYKIGMLFPFRDTPLANIEGHEKRVSRVAYHPSGRFLATCWWVFVKVGCKRPKHTSTVPLITIWAST